MDSEVLHIIGLNLISTIGHNLYLKIEVLLRNILFPVEFPKVLF